MCGVNHCNINGKMRHMGSRLVKNVIFVEQIVPLFSF